jgi:hypothetical protein
MARKLLIRLFAGVIIASIWTGAASVAGAQQTSEKNKPAATKTDPVVAAGDSVSIADVQRAAEELAAAVQAAVKKATEDPALKVAALKVATNAVQRSPGRSDAAGSNSSDGTRFTGERDSHRNGKADKTKKSLAFLPARPNFGAG